MNLDKALELASITLREPTTFLPADHQLRHFLQWFVDTLGVDPGCGAIEPAVGEDTNGEPAVLVPEEWVGHYSPDETLGLAVMLVRAKERVADEAAMRELNEPTPRKAAPEQEWERD